MTDRVLVEVDCPSCRDTHLLGIPPDTTTIQAWCARSGRPIAIDLEVTTPPTST